MKNIFFLSTLLVFLMACQSSSTEEMVEETVVEIEEVVEVAPVVTFLPLPLEYVEKLHNSCDNIEATFYQTSQSMSTASTLDFINMFDFSNTPATLNTTDNGHIMFLSEGSQILLGKISLSPTSNYIYFEIDGQKYYNTIQEGSLPFLQGIALPPQ